MVAANVKIKQVTPSAGTETRVKVLQPCRCQLLAEVSGPPSLSLVAEIWTNIPTSAAQHSQWHAVPLAPSSVLPASSDHHDNVCRLFEFEGVIIPLLPGDYELTARVKPLPRGIRLSDSAEEKGGKKVVSVLGSQAESVKAVSTLGKTALGRLNRESKERVLQSLLDFLTPAEEHCGDWTWAGNYGSNAVLKVADSSSLSSQPLIPATLYSRIRMSKFFYEGTFRANKAKSAALEGQKQQVRSYGLRQFFHRRSSEDLGTVSVSLSVAYFAALLSAKAYSCVVKNKKLSHALFDGSIEGEAIAASPLKLLQLCRSILIIVTSIPWCQDKANTYRLLSWALGSQRIAADVMTPLRQTVLPIAHEAIWMRLPVSLDEESNICNQGLEQLLLVVGDIFDESGGYRDTATERGTSSALSTEEPKSRPLQSYAVHKLNARAMQRTGSGTSLSSMPVLSLPGHNSVVLLEMVVKAVQTADEDLVSNRLVQIAVSSVQTLSEKSPKKLLMFQVMKALLLRHQPARLQGYIFECISQALVDRADAAVLIGLVTSSGLNMAVGCTPKRTLALAKSTWVGGEVDVLLRACKEVLPSIDKDGKFAERLHCPIVKLLLALDEEAVSELSMASGLAIEISRRSSSSFERLISTILKSWPLGDSSKEIRLLNVLYGILEVSGDMLQRLMSGAPRKVNGRSPAGMSVCRPADGQGVVKQLLNRLISSVQSPHAMLAMKGIQMCKKLQPKLILLGQGVVRKLQHALYTTGSDHWHPDIRKLALEVSKLYHVAPSIVGERGSLSPLPDAANRLGYAQASQGRTSSPRLADQVRSQRISASSPLNRTLAPNVPHRQLSASPGRRSLSVSRGYGSLTSFSPSDLREGREGRRVIHSRTSTLKTLPLP